MIREGDLYVPEHNGLSAEAEANSNAASTKYSNAESVNSNGFNINLNKFQETLSLLELYTEKPEEKEGDFFNLKEMPPYDISDVVMFKKELSDESLRIFDRYEGKKINTAIGYLKEVRDKLSGVYKTDLKHLKYIRKMLAYILYRALPAVIKPPPKDDGAGSKGGYRRRCSKKVKRSRRRLTHRR
jgi:hypothetical protein